MTFQDFQNAVMSTDLLTETEKKQYIKLWEWVEPNVLDEMINIIHEEEQSFVNDVKKHNEELAKEAVKKMKSRISEIKVNEAKSIKEDAVLLSKLENMLFT